MNQIRISAKDDDDYDDIDVYDDVFIYLTQHCRLLRRTSLASTEFYDKTWRKYVRTVTLIGSFAPEPVLRQLQRTASLEHLHLQDLADLRDSDIAFLPKLTVLSSFTIVSCPGLTNAAFRSVAALPHLTELQVADLPTVSDEAFLQLVNLSKLASLTCIRMPKMTDASLEVLLSATQSLTTLLLHECALVRIHCRLPYQGLIVFCC